jgi:Clathrin adaptor complex small chain
VCVDANDNELAYLEAIHLFVEILGAFSLPVKIEGCLVAYTEIDAFFDNVCELDLVFNFYKVRRDILTLRADIDPVADIRFMPFWTKYFWQERLKKRAKMWSCPD